ncbi:MAG: acyltransferase family protein [Blautia sp.]|nr:acyltransferase family protein [Blautia sp.]
MAQTGERKKYLDAAKGWGINMIVFGHITALGNPIDRYFATYKLAIFFFVSGYLLFITGSMKKYSVGQFARRHLRSLMLPYAGYSALILLYAVTADFYRGKPLAKITGRILNHGYEFVTLRGHSTMWFLPCLFLAQMLLVIIIRLPVFIRLLSLVLPVFSSIYFDNLLHQLKGQLDSSAYKLVSYPILTVSKAIFAFWYVFVGYLCACLLCKKYKQEETGRRSGTLREIVKFAAGLGLSLLTVWLSTKMKSVDINSMILGTKPLLLMVAGVSGSLGAVLVLEYIEKWLPLRYLCWTGRNSLIIMATHGTLGFKQLCIRGWKDFYGLAAKAGMKYYLDCIGIQCHLMLIECGVVSLITGYLPWLSGRGRSGSANRTAS